MIATFTTRTRLRKLPTTASSIIRLMDVGESATILSEVSVRKDGLDWFAMRANDGTTGWAARMLGSVELFVISEAPSDLDRFSDVELLALMVAGEAGGQPLAGEVAVLRVATQRVVLQRPHYGLTLRTVLRKPFQFSTFNDDHWRKFTGHIAANLQLAELAIEHLLASPFPQATHYCRFDLAPMPAWTQERFSTRLGQIGDHVFYVEK